MCDLFGGDSKPKTVSTSSTSGPWGPSQPGLKTAINDFTNLYKSGGTNLDYFPISTVAPLAPERQQAWQMISDRAKNGSPLNDQAKGYFSDVMGGKYLNADAPGMQGVLDQIRTGVNGNFAQGGRYGSGAHDSAVTSALAPTILSNYQNERGIQNQAAQFAPQLAQQDYFDANQLANVGQQRQGYLQDQLNDEVKRFNWNQQQPINSIQLLRDFLTGTGGSQTTSTQPYQGSSNNPWASAVGTGASLLGSYVGAGGTF